MSSYVAQPLSRVKIRNLALEMRDALGVKDVKEFPVMQFLEHILPQVDPEFVYDVMPIHEMGGHYGLAIPQDHTILLREDVYENAVKGVPRDRFTVAHEIGHYFLHTPSRVAFARGNDLRKVPAYLNPEWQANTFAGELLAPPNVIKDLSLFEIMSHCKVSRKVAEIQIRDC
ncbi:ImmA/IrrE family metallo-endopeptidase [Cohnella terricola]|uniref:ImmA/IrrE family metallo-endopeptidase n=1 Tax=Cohnella terricola TaxID=1289167 RepID=A0A559JL88_9BACL|nr:ImmA/IrrE family metallo-endopeptidase [Cohnella terricola]TVY00630.1 ImmA/IrrE family metallo-endopeptidase [Cohnella terricola]